MTIALAGSSKYTREVAATLVKDFTISWILTPSPRKIGRNQVLTKNPLQQWALENEIETFLVEKKIDRASFEQKMAEKAIDILLVVDFGYLVPQWLLDLPKIAPLNIHPSKLPRWRGSSPGQLALLFQDYLPFGGKETAVTLMVMDAKLDQGPIIAQLPFKISEHWTQTAYYDTAFNLICQNLASKIKDFATAKIASKKQTVESETPVARRLKKDDAFVDWPILQKLMKLDGKLVEIEEKKEQPLLLSVLSDKKFAANKLAQIKFVKNAALAFSPWPNLWTIIPTKKGSKRMKILTAHWQNEKNEQELAQLVLDQIQIEGKTTCQWREIANLLA